KERVGQRSSGNFSEAPPARMASGRARIRGRAFLALRRARRLVIEHRAPVLDLADCLAHLRAQSLLGVIPLPGAGLVEFLQMIAPPLGERMPLARQSLGLPGLGVGIVHGRATAVRLISQGSSWRTRTSRTKTRDAAVAYTTVDNPPEPPAGPYAHD